MFLIIIIIMKSNYLPEWNNTTTSYNNRNDLNYDCVKTLVLNMSRERERMRDREKETVIEREKKREIKREIKREKKGNKDS